MSTDQVLTVNEVAARLHIHRRTVLRHLKTGRLRGTKQGALWFIRASAVDRFLDPSPRTGDPADAA